MSGFPMLVIGFIVIVGVFVVGSILFRAGKAVSEWNYNNSQPVRAVPAKVIGKRTNVDVRHRHHDNHTHHHTSTDYFVTFELESGERIEFEVSGSESGVLIEGDDGELTYQGSRYLGFVRRRADGTPAPGQKINEPPMRPPGQLSGALCVRCEAPLVVESKSCPSCGWMQPG